MIKDVLFSEKNKDEIRIRFLNKDLVLKAKSKNLNDENWFEILSDSFNELKGFEFVRAYEKRNNFIVPRKYENNMTNMIFILIIETKYYPLLIQLKEKSEIWKKLPKDIIKLISEKIGIKKFKFTRKNLSKNGIYSGYLEIFYLLKIK